MNHPFLPSQLNPLQCHNCKRTESDHGVDAQCESCFNTGICNLVGDILMCADCERANKPTCDFCGGAWPLKQFGPKRACQPCIQTEMRNAVAAAKERDASIKDSSGYFTAHTTPICEIKELIDLSQIADGRFELHKFVRERFEHFASVLFTKSDELSAAARNQQLVIEFRAQVREQIKASDLQYQPKEKAPKVRAPKMGKGKPKSIQEKMAQLLVASEAKKGNVISMQQALAKIESDFS